MKTNATTEKLLKNIATNQQTNKLNQEGNTKYP